MLSTILLKDMRLKLMLPVFKSSHLFDLNSLLSNNYQFKSLIINYHTRFSDLLQS